MRERVIGAGLVLGPWLLGGSVLLHFVLLQRPRSLEQVDLRVYVEAPPALLHGGLYDFSTSQFTPDFSLPFTYPPFAALVLLPLSWLPFLLAVQLWHAASIGCLWWIVQRCLTMLRVPATGRHAALWTAAALWFEPVRFTLNYGQINLLLLALGLWALTVARDRASGIGLGLASAIKLTPAVGWLYLLAARRWRAAAWAVGTGLGTVVVAAVIAPGQSARYWLEMLGRVERIGPAASAINQSLRGGLSRSLGYDVGNGWPWLLAIVLAALLSGWALRSALRRPDEHRVDLLAAVLAVQLFGLLASPVSWSHHWVWVVPALVWAVHGPARRHPLVIASAVVWGVVVTLPVITWLLRAQPTIWQIARPWPLSALGWVYPVAGVLLLVAVAVGCRMVRVPAAMPEPQRVPAVT